MRTVWIAGRRVAWMMLAGMLLGDGAYAGPAEPGPAGRRGGARGPRGAEAPDLPPGLHGERLMQMVRDRKEAVMGRLQREDPEEYERLRALERTDPDAFRNELRRMLGERLGDTKRGRGIVEDMLCEQLAGEYRKETDPEKRKAILAELKKAVEDAFDRRLQEQLLRVQDWEEKVKALRERLEARQKSRESICAKRLNDLIEVPELRW
ncbi:MAG: hypothetical protein JXR37_04865 [Kiritimatiellae bacterium]|nr:hypothetical protein [Kiritimatiellia bacterium]